ncbi:MAG: hypothetical protein AAF899_11720 [Pseudomonadota bacterium]
MNDLMVTLDQGAGGATQPNLTQAGQNDGPSFDQMLADFQQMHDASVEPTAQVDATPPVEQKEPTNVIETVLDRADGSYNRLEGMIDSLDHSTPHSIEEVMQLQIEMHKLSMQLEVSTKAVTESASATKQIFQQQI